MIEVPTLPGLYYQQVPRRAEPSPLRSDVAGFVGRTQRGPVGTAVRVEGLRDFCREFGGPERDSDFFPAVRGYFENGGQVAYIVRIHPDDERRAFDVWNVEGTKGGVPNLAARYRVTASSAGTWADGLRVLISYDASGPAGNAVLSMRVESACEATESIRVVVPRITDQEPGNASQEPTLEQLVSRQSRLIRIEPLEECGGDPQGQASSPGPRVRRWDVMLKLPDGAAPKAQEGASVGQQYVQAVLVLGDQSEVAILAAPSLHRDIANEDSRRRVMQAMVDEAVQTQDRLVLIDPPPSLADANDAEKAIEFAADLRRIIAAPDHRRVAAVYYPWLRVNNRSGDVTQPVRTIAPSGHVAGVMSRVDRERGAHHTPANVPVFDAVDIESPVDRDSAGALSTANVNAIRCIPGRGLMIQGGRTLDLSRDGRFVGHRRFIHRLIRAIRRVAEPDVFETNGPELWLTLIRAITTVLLEAFRSGALQGERPEEAFRVRCDEQTNPLTEREQGRVLCEIDLALAAPMEFITIRVSVSADGQVEVFDA